MSDLIESEKCIKITEYGMIIAYKLKPDAAKRLAINQVDVHRVDAPLRQEVTRPCRDPLIRASIIYIALSVAAAILTTQYFTHLDNRHEQTKLDRAIIEAEYETYQASHRRATP